jgi:hypothetical protein
MGSESMHLSVQKSTMTTWPAEWGYVYTFGHGHLASIVQ